MSIRDDITGAMKTAMKAGDSGRLSAVRLIMAKLKDADIAARPRGVERISDDEVLALLRGMIKPRREAMSRLRPRVARTPRRSAVKRRRPTRT